MAMLTQAEHGIRTGHGRTTIADRLRQMLARFREARRAHRDFESLRTANDYLLSDIGLTRGQLNHALAAPFWVNPTSRIAIDDNGKRR